MRLSPFVFIIPYGHTNVALLLYAGEDIENISAHLGHASSDITSRVYAHMYAEVKIRMAKTISKALFCDDTK